MAARGYKCILRVASTRLLVGIARNVEPTFTAAEQDITTRDSGGFDEGQPGRRRMTARIETLWVATNAGLVALRDSWYLQTVLAFWITDESGYGDAGECFVTELTIGPQDLDNAVMCSVSIRSTGTILKVAANTTVAATTGAP